VSYDVCKVLNIGWYISLMRLRSAIHVPTTHMHIQLNRCNYTYIHLFESGNSNYETEKRQRHCGLYIMIDLVPFLFIFIFTALHGMQTRSSDYNSVRPSVRLSNA